MALFVPQEAKRGLVSLDNGEYTLRNILLPVDHAPNCAEAIDLAKRTAGIFGEGRVAITCCTLAAVLRRRCVWRIRRRGR